jgi:replicative DNA helicase
MIVNIDEQLQKIKDIRTGKIKEGLKLGIESIDEFLRFKPSNFNVILGHANVGKTTVIMYMMLLYARKHNVKWLVYSSENEPYTLIRKFIEFIEAEPINRIEIATIETHTEWINEHFKFIDPNVLHSYKSLLEVANSVLKQWKYNGLLIDPYNSLMKDKEFTTMNGHEYDYMVTSELRVFCKTNNVTIWLNTHAATDALRKKHSQREQYEGHPIPPMASDVEGGGKFVNRADDFWVIHRYIQHPTDWMYSMIHVRKVKDIDSGGRPTPIDSPIMLRSIKNNVGFTIGGRNIIDVKPKVTQNLPF